MALTARTILSLPDVASLRKLGTSSRKNSSAAAAVARMELVAHAERALDDGFQRNAVIWRSASAITGTISFCTSEQAVPDAVVIHAIVQAARIAAFVDVAAGDIAERPVLDHEHRHRSGVDSGKRPDAAEVVAASDLDLAGIEPGDGLVPVPGEVLEQGAADDGLALAADIIGPRHRRTGGEDGFRVKPGMNSRPGAHRPGLDRTWSAARRQACWPRCACPRQTASVPPRIS